jgi:hypothetical protein
MTAPIRILVKASIATLLVGVTFASTAHASSGDPMSRDVEFRESLARHDDASETATPRPAFRFLPRRADTSKKDRAPK